jgi:hypothetical protein
MYLGTVKHRSNELVEKLEDSLTFTKEIRHRFKCVFQVPTVLFFMKNLILVPLRTLNSRYQVPFNFFFSLKFVGKDSS